MIWVMTYILYSLSSHIAPLRYRSLVIFVRLSPSAPPTTCSVYISTIVVRCKDRVNGTLHVVRLTLRAVIDRYFDLLLFMVMINVQSNLILFNDTNILEKHKIFAK